MDVRSQPTIIVELAIKNSKVDERVSYTNKETARERKKALQALIKARKKERGDGDGKGPDHSEDLDHDSWVTKPGEIVVFRCRSYFKLFVDYDTHVCPPVPDARFCLRRCGCADCGGVGFRDQHDSGIQDLSYLRLAAGGGDGGDNPCPVRLRLNLHRHGGGTGEPVI